MKLLNTPLELKLLTLKRELTDTQCVHPDSIETREHWRELVYYCDIPVKYIPIHLGIFGTITVLDYNHRTQ